MAKFVADDSEQVDFLGGQAAGGCQELRGIGGGIEDGVNGRRVDEPTDPGGIGADRDLIAVRPAEDTGRQWGDLDGELAQGLQGCRIVDGCGPDRFRFRDDGRPELRWSKASWMPAAIPTPLANNCGDPGARDSKST